MLVILYDLFLNSRENVVRLPGFVISVGQLLVVQMVSNGTYKTNITSSMDLHLITVVTFVTRSLALQMPCVIIFVAFITNLVALKSLRVLNNLLFLFIVIVYNYLLFLYLFCIILLLVKKNKLYISYFTCLSLFLSHISMFFICICPITFLYNNIIRLI